MLTKGMDSEGKVHPCILQTSRISQSQVPPREENYEFIRIPDFERRLSCEDQTSRRPPLTTSGVFFPVIKDKIIFTLYRFSLPTNSKPHGIAYCSQRNIIFVANSGLDCVTIHDGDSYRLLDQYKFSDK